MNRTFRLLLLLALAAIGGVSGSAAEARVDAAFKTFWDAKTPQDASAAVEAIEQSGISFDDAAARLKTGRPYSKDVPTGVVQATRRTDRVTFYYSLEVPNSYDPSRTYHVRLQLHGGVTAREDNRPSGNGGIGALGGDEQIYILPTSWVDAPWWSEAQARNLGAILDAVKRTYNVDENRVAVSGVSDGGTASFYVAMRDTTPYASFLPLNGSVMLLATRNLGLGDLFLNNLRNKPFFVVNGGLDPLYPTSAIDPVIRYLQSGGVSVVYRPQPNAGHDTSWWPDVRMSFEQFVRDHPRNPLPDVMTWQRGEDDPFARAHWLVVDRLAGNSVATGDTPLPDVNVIPTPRTTQFGLMTAGSRVTRVLPGSSASVFGFKANDVIVSINGEALPPSADLDQVLATCCRAGAAVHFRVAREARTVDVIGTYQPGSTLGATVSLFPRRRPNGRVDLVKTGNTVRVTTSGVAEYTLLLSPSAFDFTRPVTVVTNGKRSFEGRVEKSLATLLRWAAVDNDRTMLFGAELHIKVGS